MIVCFKKMPNYEKNYGKNNSTDKLFLEFRKYFKYEFFS